MFIALDVNGDGHVDFKELCCGISAACRGPIAERVKFCFKVFDKDQDGVLNPEELSSMIDVLGLVAKESKSNQSRMMSLETSKHNPTTKLPEWLEADSPVLHNLQRKLSCNGSLSQEDFLIWGVDDNVLVSPLLELLFEVCHVSLGLKPHCRHHEYEIGNPTFTCFNRVFKCFFF